MPAIRRHWSSEDVRALIDENRPWPRYELIDGELLVTPAPGGAHQIAVAEVWRLVDAYVEASELGLALMSPADLELRPGTITQPDVFVISATTRIAGEALEWPDVQSLLLAVEIISPSSARIDRVVKRDFYLSSGIAEYWIVDLDARAVERWRPESGRPEIIRDRVEWPAGNAAPLIIELPALFDRISAKQHRFAQRA